MKKGVDRIRWLIAAILIASAALHFLLNRAFLFSCELIDALFEKVGPVQHSYNRMGETVLAINSIWVIIAVDIALVFVILSKKSSEKHVLLIFSVSSLLIVIIVVYFLAMFGSTTFVSIIEEGAKGGLMSP